MSDHTPGPWSVPHFAIPDVNCQCGYVLTDHMMGAVCTVHVSGEGDDWVKNGDNPKYEEACANARLIAAAPDLLAALQHIFSEIDDGDGAPGHSHDVPGIWDSDNATGVAGTACEWCAQWEAARAAIAKATGGAA